MKIPASPPDHRQLVATLAADPARVAAVIRQARAVDDKGRYLSWDEFRRRPAPDGLNHSEWWSAVKIARNAAATRLPLVDARGRAFSFVEPPALRALLRFADMQAAGNLAGDGSPLGEGAGRRHLAHSLAEEPFASSLIEGAATTRAIAKKMIFDDRQPRTRDELMVLNNYRGLEFVKSIQRASLSPDAIRELHRIITAGTLDNHADAGRIRTSDDIQVVDDTTGEVLHQPPPHVDLERRMKALCDFANAGDVGHDFVHPILRATILHFALAYEHPFVDGNGRTARALFYWSALRQGYWLIEYASISSVIAEAKIAYGKAFLDSEVDDGDLTYFLVHQCSVLKTAIERLHAYLARRRREVAALEEALSRRRGPGAFNHRQSTLLNDIIQERQTRVTVAEHQTRHQVSYLTARNDLETLASARLLRRSKQGRIVVYRPVADLLKRLPGPPPGKTSTA